MSAPRPCPVCRQDRTERFCSVRDPDRIRDYWCCDVCEARFLDPDHRLGPAEERAQYDLHRNDPSDPGYRRFLSRLVDPLCAVLASEASGLDFGCGPGPALAGMMREAGHRMAMYDPAYAPDTGPLAARYDFLTCTEVVEHLHDPHAVFALFDRLVRPGGIIAVMTTFQTDDARFAGWHYRRDPTHVVFYRMATFGWIAERFGWRLRNPVKNVAFFVSRGSGTHANVAVES